MISSFSKLSLQWASRKTSAFSPLSVSKCFSSPMSTRLHHIQIQQAAPSFKLSAVVNEKVKTVSLDDYKGRWLVLLFYPLDFTFVCPTEIIAFSDRAEEFRKLNAEVVGISVDSVYSHLNWISQDRKKGGLGPMKIPLLSDLNKEMSKSYNVLHKDGIAFRGLFIIDPNQKLRQITVNDLPVGRDVDETLRLLQAFQFTDLHGEVCPAGWKPGKPTINTTKPEKYFSQVK
eukprot:Sdes_comp9440_c0_seq1m905